MLRRAPFWKSTTILFNYRRDLALALTAAALSAMCFGAGLGMIYPAMVLLLEKQLTIQEVIYQYVLKPSQPVFVQNAIRSIAEHAPADRFMSFVTVMGAIAVMTLLAGFLRYVHELTTIGVVFKAAQAWRSRLYTRLIRSHLDGALHAGYADALARLVADTQQLAQGYQSLMGRTVAEAFRGTAALCLAFYINPLMTLLALVVVPPMYMLLRQFGRRIRKAAKRAMEERGKMIAAVNESLGGLAVVKVHDAEGYERRRYHRLNRELMAQQMKARSARALSSPVVEVFTLLGVITMASIAAYLIFRRGFSAEQFMAVLLMLAAGAGSLKPLTNIFNELNESAAAATRIFEALSMPIEPISAADRARMPRLARHTKEIHFESVTYQYPTKETPAVIDVDLRVAFGETIAIVGGNGAGKSTLMSMLPRLLSPRSGRVTIDGTEIAGVNLRSLRNQIAVVSQQSILFEGTISDNIAYGRRWTSPSQIIEAAQRAFADEFIRTLPQGYMTRLGEGGTGLSGGQRQRICIARAILRDPAILILDEATSQIDAESEHKISQALRTLREGRTTFIIAHRLSTVIDADLIVVMSDGRIIDRGKHEELLGRCALYQQLIRTQLLTPTAASA